ncbi:conserved hypothetical protein [Methanosalsum zhilinae DSM 4017]|uniref:Uncharacterized protein n=1 Tax=Methanosalsum zhilinae (strain DSM 4017 / NBRC 107636 / OCM 62 / WeN5) TaxID=679901 RepID=F7XNQ7_METZD|nr:conserved hypothetical protein [Methanosalsum zhilinae DSM 4017]
MHISYHRVDLLKMSELVTNPYIWNQDEALRIAERYLIEGSI